MALEIPTYANNENLFYIFNGVVSILGDSEWTAAIRTILYLGIFFWVFRLVWKPVYGEYGKWFLQFILISSCLFAPVSTVVLVDRTNNQGPRTVDNVPLALAMMTHIPATFGDFLREKTETVMSLPDDFKLQHDMLFAHRLFKMANQASISDPELRADLFQFFKDCTAYDIRDFDGVNGVDIRKLRNDGGAWDHVFDNANPGRFVSTRTLSNPVLTDSCLSVAKGGGTVSAADSLKSRIAAEYATAIKVFGQEINPLTVDPAIAAAAFSTQLSGAYELIFGATTSASASIQQAMFINLWREAGTALPAMMGDPAAVGASMATAQASAATEGSLRAQGVMASNVLPKVWNIVQGIVIIVFPFIFLYMLAVQMEEAGGMLKMYILTHLWLQLWPWLFAVINFFRVQDLALRAKAMKVNVENGIPMAAMDQFNGEVISSMAITGELLWMVPAIASMLVFFMQKGLTSLAPTPGKQQSAGAGQEVSTGNVRLGSTSLDSFSTNSTMMNTASTDVSARVGARSVRNSFGDMFSAHGGSDSALTVTAAMNHLPVGLGAGVGIDGGFSTRTSKGADAARHDSVNVARSNVATFMESLGYHQFRGKSQGDTKSWQHGKDGSETTNNGIRYGENDSYSDQGRWSHGINDQSHLGLDINSPGGRSIPVSNKNTKEGKHQQNQNQKLAQESGLSEDQASAVRAARASGANDKQIRSMFSDMFSVSGGAGVARYESDSLERALTATKDFGRSKDAARLNQFIEQARVSNDYHAGTDSGQRSDKDNRATGGRESRYSNERGERYQSTLAFSQDTHSDTRRWANVTSELLGTAEGFDRVARFHNTSAPNLMAMAHVNPAKLEGLVREYLSAEAAFSNVTPTSFADGRPAPTSVGDIRTAYTTNADAIKDTTGGDFDRFSRQTGAGSVAPVDPTKTVDQANKGVDRAAGEARDEYKSAEYDATGNSARVRTQDQLNGSTINVNPDNLAPVIGQQNLGKREKKK